MVLLKEMVKLRSLRMFYVHLLPQGVMLFLLLFIDLCTSEWCWNGAHAVAGKEFEGEKEVYNNGEWNERVEKWKVKQEKRGFLGKDNGNKDRGDDDEFL